MMRQTLSCGSVVGMVVLSSTCYWRISRGVYVQLPYGRTYAMDEITATAMLCGNMGDSNNDRVRILTKAISYDDVVDDWRMK
jgi:hypothetical protein